jgi:hypothetical protein
MSVGTDTWAAFFEKLKARVQRRYLQDDLATTLCAMLHQVFGSQPRLVQYAVPASEKNGDKQEVDELAHPSRRSH